MTVFVCSLTGAESMTRELLGALARSRTVLAPPDLGAELESWPVGGVTRAWEDGSLEEGVGLIEHAGPERGVTVLLTGDSREKRGAELVARLRELQIRARIVLSGVDGVGAAPDTVSREWARTWVPRRPLLGWRVLVTRPEHQADSLAQALQLRGAEVVRFPLIRTVPAADPGPLDRALTALGRYGWIVFTSANGVRSFHERLLASGKDVRALEGIQIAAIGAATTESLATVGLDADLQPDRYVAEELLEALERIGSWRGVRVLLPRAKEARDIVPEGLRSLGALVDDVEAYRTETVRDADSEGVRTMLRDGSLDLVTFTASSAVRAFLEVVGTLGGARGVAIGPITAETARAAGLAVATIAHESTIEGLVNACESLAREECA